MDLISAYQVINQSTLAVVQSLNTLNVVEERQSKPAEYIRVKENPFNLTDGVKQHAQVAAAHNLNQYKNQFHSIKLEEEADSWLLHLLKVDESEGLV